MFDLAFFAQAKEWSSALNYLYAWYFFFRMFLSSADSFLDYYFFTKDSFRNTIRVSNSKVPYQALRLNNFFSYSTQLSTNFILLINVKMLTIVGILTFISMINTRF